MESSIVELITQVGIPVGFFVYYLFVLQPRQEGRHDALVDRMLSAQKECSEKMDSALQEHNEYIHKLTEAIESTGSLTIKGK